MCTAREPAPHRAVAPGMRKGDHQKQWDGEWRFGDKASHLPSGIPSFPPLVFLPFLLRRGQYVAHAGSEGTCEKPKDFQAFYRTGFRSC